jgi:hypothetical protein
MTLRTRLAGGAAARLRLKLPFGPLDISPASSDSPVKMRWERTPHQRMPLELLILKTLTVRELHGYAIAQRVKTRSEDVLQVVENSLYPALQRLLLKGWVKAEWGASENAT